MTHKIITCENCGKPIGIYTNKEIAEKINELTVEKPFRFVCKTCKTFIESKEG